MEGAQGLLLAFADSSFRIYYGNNYGQKLGEQMNKYLLRAILWTIIMAVFGGSAIIAPSPLSLLAFAGFTIVCTLNWVEFSKRKAKVPPPAQASTPPDDIETRLQRLDDLKEKDLLTDAEYQAKREEIFGEV